AGHGDTAAFDGDGPTLPRVHRFIHECPPLDLPAESPNSSASAFGIALMVNKNREHIELDCAKQRLRLPEPWCDAVGLQHASPPPLGIGAPPVARSAPKFVSPTERISRR